MLEGPWLHKMAFPTQLVRPLDESQGSSPLQGHNSWIMCEVVLSNEFQIIACPTSLRRCEWRVCGRGQTASKPSIHKVHLMVYKTAWATQKNHCGRWNFGEWKLNVCKMKGLIVYPIAYVWDFEGSERDPWVFNVVPRSSTFRKKEVGLRIPPLASSPSQVNLMEDLVCKFSFKLCEKMEVEISSNVKFFKLYPREREAKN